MRLCASLDIDSATLRRTRTLSKFSRSDHPEPSSPPNRGFKGAGLREPVSKDVCYLELPLCQRVTGYGGCATRRSSEVPAPTTMWIKTFRARCGLMVSVLRTLLEIHRFVLRFTSGLANICLRHGSMAKVPEQATTLTEAAPAGVACRPQWTPTTPWHGK